MDSFSDYLWVELFALGFGLFGWIGGFSSLKKARLIEDTPTSKIRSAPQGYVEIIGVAEDNPEAETVIARLTGTPCVWFSYEIEKYERRGKNSSWRTIEKKSSSAPIIVNDSTGTCFVHPDKADVTPSLKKVWYGGSRYPTSSESGGLFNRRYRYTEQRIHAGQMLYALGHFETLHPPSMEAQTKAAKKDIVLAWKRDYDTLVERFDRNGDGEIDLQEWKQVGIAARKAAEKQVRDNYDHTPVNVMSYSPVRRQPFLISTSDPKDLSRKYRWQFIGLGLLGVVCTLGFIYLLPGTIQAFQGWQ